MSHAYWLSALKLVSDIELPELLPWEGGDDVPADLVFQLGRIPARLGGLSSEARPCQQFLGIYPGEARVLVENGRTVTVEPVPGSVSIDARSILMAPVQAMLWHQRGLLPLHASVVATDGSAIALAGPSGAGKSTLAAVLATRGHAVLADDICVLDAAARVDVLASTRRLRLWRDALDHLTIDADGLPRASSRSEKYLIEGRNWDGPTRQRLSAVILLGRHKADTIFLKRLRGAESIIALHDVVHLRPEACALGYGPAIFTALTTIASHGVGVWRLIVPDDRRRLDDIAAVIAKVEGNIDH